MKLRWIVPLGCTLSTLTFGAIYSPPPTWTPQELGSGPVQGGETPDPFPQAIVPFPLPVPNTVDPHDGSILFGDLLLREDGTAILVYTKATSTGRDVFAIAWNG